MTESRAPVQHNPRFVAAIAAALLVALSSAGGWLGYISVVNNHGTPQASIFGFGAVMVGIGVIFIAASPSYGRLSALLYRPLGAIVLIAGFGFASGGLAAIVLPRFNYIGAWGTEVGLVVLIGLLARGVADLFSYANRNKKYIKRTSPRVEPLTVFISHSGNNWFSLFAGGGAILLLTVSLWV